jgi:DNA-binding MarR family transcriptional regulator
VGYVKKTRRLSLDQKRVLDEITMSVCRDGKLLTMREISDATTMKPSRVGDVLSRLIVLGRIQRHVSWHKRVGEEGRPIKWRYGLASSPATYALYQMEDRV